MEDAGNGAAAHAGRDSSPRDQRISPGRLVCVTQSSTQRAAMEFAHCGSPLGSVAYGRGLYSLSQQLPLFPSPLALLSVAEIYEQADQELLVRLKEDRRIERKPP